MNYFRYHCKADGLRHSLFYLGINSPDWRRLGMKFLNWPDDIHRAILPSFFTSKLISVHFFSYIHNKSWLHSFKTLFVMEFAKYYSRSIKNLFREEKKSTICLEMFGQREPQSWGAIIQPRADVVWASKSLSQLLYRFVNIPIFLASTLIRHCLMLDTYILPLPLPLPLPLTLSLLHLMALNVDSSAVSSDG